MKTILVVFGTRPEAIKLAPFILRAKEDKRFHVVVGSTGQHREMLKPLLNFFDITPDFDLDLMKPGQSLVDISMGVMKGLNDYLLNHKVDGIVVQGDTSSCFIASLVAFYHRIPVIHVEAGLRSGDIYSPYPEEFNRKATGLVAKFHFAPTETSKQNLLHEHYSPESIFVTGNTGIDALFEVNKRLTASTLGEQFTQKYSFLNPKKKLILVTVHRRESFGKPMEEVMKGLVALSKREDVELLIPLHMNPQVRASAEKIFGDAACWIDKGQSVQPGQSKIWLCEPIDYVPFVYLMNQAHLIITDSGGIQEEAPSLGKPILVAREKTERPEAILAGTSKLIPLEHLAFLKTAEEVLDTPEIYNKMSHAKNPFGDGKSCERILNVLAEQL
ncbi:non-hydrolyzing UDP-N-acetylglucosamine 2-epimerase [Bdellovibrio svalbardensis]|uniref:UDP-N-acetylglucosamine 2-epimerase (non-hydrolyzing) n=1 Tax=Bdellovibrio svalbardensis TaxID=2972972 RepID=A0ABT6DKI5_9BACT|nr:UDP-N-acetylglucosamine 2-epimerase (non-hydrolyzing) [Bdellovibrio svalbardensis]MDG0817373.1 UDP-N-acetylglucosamine 2-epimerase (non-hydrolyzing) [Bdellovibrio svalbardensis]